MKGNLVSCCLHICRFIRFRDMGSEQQKTLYTIVPEARRKWMSRGHPGELPHCSHHRSSAHRSGEHPVSHSRQVLICDCTEYHRIVLSSAPCCSQACVPPCRVAEQWRMMLCVAQSLAVEGTAAVGKQAGNQEAHAGNKAGPSATHDAVCVVQGGLYQTGHRLWRLGRAASWPLRDLTCQCNSLR
jgi:hypothetical protein